MFISTLIPITSNLSGWSMHCSIVLICEIALKYKSVYNCIFCHLFAFRLSNTLPFGRHISLYSFNMASSINSILSFTFVGNLETRSRSSSILLNSDFSNTFPNE